MFNSFPSDILKWKEGKKGVSVFPAVLWQFGVFLFHGYEYNYIYECIYIYIQITGELGKHSVLFFFSAKLKKVINDLHFIKAVLGRKFLGVK